MTMILRKLNTTVQLVDDNDDMTGRKGEVVRSRCWDEGKAEKGEGKGGEKREMGKGQAEGARSTQYGRMPAASVPVAWAVDWDGG